MSRVGEWLLDLLFPPKCPFCRGLVELDGMVCGACLRDLPRRKNQRVTVPLAEEAIAPFAYEGVVRDALRRFKFGGLPGYARSLAPLLAGPVRETFGGRDLILSFVPVSRRRRGSRGYDQAELLARAVGAVLGWEVVPTLVKVRNNPPQSGQKSSAARRGNVSGVYRVTDPERVAGKSILILDDIVTTGATFSECVLTLRAAGAQRVFCAAFAHGEPGRKTELPEH